MVYVFTIRDPRIKIASSDFLAEMKGKTEKILCGFSSIFPKYLEKCARKMRAGRYETGSEGKFASRWRANSPDALCAVLL